MAGGVGVGGDQDRFPPNSRPRSTAAANGGKYSAPFSFFLLQKNNFHSWRDSNNPEEGFKNGELEGGRPQCRTYVRSCSRGFSSGCLENSFAAFAMYVHVFRLVLGFIIFFVHFWRKAFNEVGCAILPILEALPAAAAFSYFDESGGDSAQQKRRR